MIEFKRLTLAEAMEYSAVWDAVCQLMVDRGVSGLKHVKRLEFIADIVSLVVGICPHCYEAGKDCQCWNDE